jgi:exonuclease III
MPCDNTSGQDNNQVYQDVLHDIFDHEAASQVNNIIIGGDFNTDLSRSNSAHTRCLNSVCQHESMQCVQMLQICEVDYTYQSLINGQQSCLDHFVISQNLISSITKYSVLHDGDNFSDHDVVTLKLSLSIDNIRDISAFVGKPLWHKATEQHLERYRCNLDILLSKICVPKIAVV